MAPFPKICAPLQALLLFLSFVCSAICAAVSINDNLDGPCPARCSITGPDPNNWPVYHSLEQFEGCTQRLFADFSIYDRIEEPNTIHRIRACTIWGADWESTTTNEALEVKSVEGAPVATAVNATYLLGWWNQAPSDDVPTGVLANAHTLTRQVRTYLTKGYMTSVTRSPIVFGLSKDVTIGVYLGRALQSRDLGEDALRHFSNLLYTHDMESSSVPSGFAMQLCEPGRDADHVFGMIVSTNRSISAVRAAVQGWSRAECLDGFSGTVNVEAPVVVTMPPLFPILNGTNVGDLNGSNSTGLQFTNHTLRSAFRGSLDRRANCRTIQVVSGDSCASLATKCGISGNTFMTYNPQTNFCSTLQPFQYVCCSSGTLPDLKPKQNADGSCAKYTTRSGDSCYSISAANMITLDDISKFNKNTWGWNGCDNLWVGVNMCLSSGTPPVSAPET